MLADEKKKKAKPKDDFEAKPPRTLPRHFGSETALDYVKPGHWTNAEIEVWANNFDFPNGELVTSNIDAASRPVRLDRTRFALEGFRSLALPKGQHKNTEFLIYPGTNSNRRNVTIQTYLRTQYGGGNRFQASLIANRMRPHQYIMLVLARIPEAYSSVLADMTCITPPLADVILADKNLLSDYQIRFPATTTEKRAALPSHPFGWSSTAYVIWDDFDQALMTRAQRQAMLDWLHWGGQIIVANPTSLETMQSGFLSAYLPAKAGSTSSLTEDRLSEFNSRWSMNVESKTKNFPELVPLPDTPLEAVSLELTEGSSFVPQTSELVAERRVGRGRIVVTSFDLTGAPFVRWNNKDNFMNGCLLRRAPRNFQASDTLGLSMNWVGPVLQQIFQVQRDREEERETIVDDVPPFGFNPQSDYTEDEIVRTAAESLLTTKLRYFSRDAAPYLSEDPATNPYHLDVSGYGYDNDSGIAGWNDFSEVAKNARQFLEQSSGVEVPKREFVMSTLGIYLLVLVPLNWVIFRLMGKTEWAWAAVPLIAIGGTVMVVRVAQLDIGFARSRTEVAVVELQPGYQRAHVTRFTGLYTSLSTAYRFAFDDEATAVLPFSLGSLSRAELQRQPDLVSLRTGGDSTDKKAEMIMEGMAVNSNSTGMVHTEQNLDVGQGIEFRETGADAFSLSNKTGLNIRRATVVWRKSVQDVEICQLNELATDQVVTLNFKRLMW
ncbi:MAG: hypothetical protein R3C28_05180 [Pirellulaceae bacterium]